MESSGLQHTCLLLCHFHCHRHCLVATSKQWDFQASVSNLHPLVYKGNKSPPLPSTIHEFHREVGNGEFVCSHHVFPPIPNDFSQLNFQLNCYFVTSVDRVPTACKGNKSPPPPSPTHESYQEMGNGEFVWLFNCFSNSRFFN